MHYWITGASSGIGAQLSIDLAKQGHTVSISARGEEGLLTTREQAGDAKNNINSFPLDVTNLEETLSVYQQIISSVGSVDVVVLNAGIYLPMGLDDFDIGKVQKTLDVNIMGIANGIDVIRRDMMARKSGHIAIVSSVAGYGGLPTSSAYGATKAGLINFAESLKLDCDKHGIKLQIICPGFVKTPATDKNAFPMPFIIPVEEASRRIIKGMTSNKFEIAFPRRFALILKFLNILPYRWYFALVGKTAK